MIEATSASPQLRRFDPARHGYELIQAGLYIEHLLTWQSYFRPEQFLVLDCAQLQANPVEALRRFEAFLKLPSKSYTALEEHAIHGGNGTRAAARRAASTTRTLAQLDRGLRQRLVRFFRPHNRRLYRFLGRDLDW